MGLASNLPSLWGIWSTNMASSFKPTQMTWFRQQKQWQVTGKFEVWVQSLGYGFVKQFVQWRSQATPVWIIWSSQAQWLLDTADSIRSFGGSGCENRRFVPQLWQVSCENAGWPPNLDGFPIISEQPTGAPRRPAGSCHCLSEKNGPRYGSQKWGIDANKIPLRLRTTMVSVANRSFFHIILYMLLHWIRQKSLCFVIFFEDLGAYLITKNLVAYPRGIPGKSPQDQTQKGAV